MNTFPFKIENSASIFALNQCYSTVQEILGISIRNKVVFADNITFHAFPGSSVGKESACNAGDPGSIPGLGRSVGEGIGYPLQYSWASPVAQLVKNLPEMQKTWIRSLGWEDPLEK